MVAVLDTQATVVKSDNVIPPELQETLRAAILPLEDVPENEKDWHPGSDGKVLDLVHPSLFPLIYGRSRILPKGRVELADCLERCGSGEVVPDNDDDLNWPPSNVPWLSAYDDSPKFWSNQFQWLPCEVHFTADDGVKIFSYINNLHPIEHAGLYSVIEQFITKTVPLWDETLTRFHPRLRINVDHDEWEYPLGRSRPPQDDDPPSDDDYFWELEHEWEMTNRVLVQPEPVEYTNRYTSIPDYPVNLRQQFRKQGLQVIVKLANIHLTPGTEYKGGSWHVEGALNEHICATAIYYYDSVNITESFLAFRQRVDPDEMLMKPDQVS